MKIIFILVIGVSTLFSRTVTRFEGGLIDAWHFDQGAGTSFYSVNNSSVQLFGALAWTTGKYGNAITHTEDATNKKVVLNSKIDTATPGSICLWAKMTTDDGYIFYAWTGNPPDYRLTIYPSAWGFSDVNGDIRCIDTKLLYTKDNKYHLYTLTWSSGGTNAYKDGVWLKRKATAPGVYVYNTIAIGGVWYGGSSGQTFSFDEVSLYNTELTTGQIRSLYDARKGRR